MRSHDDWLLAAAWLAAAVRPTGPYPVLHPKGEQGTAKTTFGRMLRRLFDPNKVDLRSQPREERDLAVSSQHGWALAYDNLSAVPVWLSDALCRVATGGGIGARTLYTDDEETVFEFTRPVIITSIEDVVTQPDLLDRCLALELEPIPDHKRKPEEALWAEFDAARPGILGGLLDVIARALELLPTVAAEGRPLPRLADFALFAEAVGRALGGAPGRMLELLRGSRAEADQTAVQGSPVARALLRCLEQSRAFEGTATALLDRLNKLAQETERRQPNWPKTPQALSGLLKRIAPALRRLGVEVEHTRVGHQNTRTLVIRYAPDRAGRRPSASSAGAPDLFDSGGAGADDQRPSADDPRTVPSSALEAPARQGAGAVADAADDVSQVFAGAGDIEEGEL